jgi:hypothetical protein
MQVCWFAGMTSEHFLQLLAQALEVATTHGPGGVDAAQLARTLAPRRAAVDHGASNTYRVNAGAVQRAAALQQGPA